MKSAEDWFALLLISGGVFWAASTFLPKDNSKDVVIQQQQQHIERLESELKGMERALGLSR